MTCRPIRNVPGCLGVIQLGGVCGTICDRCLSLVLVRVASHDEVNTVFDEYGLKGLLTWGACGSGEVPGPVTGDYDPGSLFAIDRGEVSGEPVNLGIRVRTKGASIFTVRSIGFVWRGDAVAKVGFSVDLDKMDHSVVERVPKVLDAARLG
jgi:hypothetical protein